MDLNPATYTEAVEMLKRYPYFAYAALKALDLTADPAVKMQLKAILAANICEMSDLREILGLNSESLADFYPDEVPPQLSTEATIDTFLEKFGNGAAPEPAIQPSGDDYASTLLDRDDEELFPLDEGGSGDDNSGDETLSAIDAFLKTTPPPQPKTRIAQKEALSESFAKILIKNHNYSKALEIIQELNLKNPEKSIYFADQIRFLKKLIINESKKL